VDTPKVSVIIPVYNGEKYILSSIKSAINQSYKNIEVIVVDDGSTDSTAEIVKGIRKLSNREKIKYIYQDNKGAASARNHAIRKSEGQYIALLDHDDIWERDKIEMQVNYMKKNPDDCLVHTDAGFIDEKGNIIKEMKRPEGFYVKGKCFKELFQQNKIRTSTVLIKKKCVDEVGGFDENIHYIEDRDLWLRLSRKYPFGYLDTVLAYYRIHKDNMTNDKIGHYTNRIKMFRKIIKNYPDAFKIVGKREVKQCLFNDIYHLAILKKEDKQFFTSILCFLKAFALSPEDIILKSFSERNRDILMWYKKRIFDTIRLNKKTNIFRKD
jgi:glycosyltransferase involved in cell wall biosynthesis